MTVGSKIRSVSEPVLVTGASGFGGSHLVDLLIQEDAPVIGWHRRAGGSREANSVRWMAVDVLDAAAVRRAIAETRPAVIYHLAGAAHTAESWRSTANTLESNVIGTHHLLEAVRMAGLSSRVLIPGSALVYRPSTEALSEDSPLGPRSPYATSKLAQERLGLHVAAEDALPVFVTRSFNHAGPRQDSSFSTSSFARQLARIEAGLLEPVIRVGNLDARRDVTDVRDVVRAYKAIVERGRPARPYNVCSGCSYRIADLLQQLVDQAYVRVEIRTEPERMRPNDMPLLLGSARRIQEEVGWAPHITIERTLHDLLDYWRAETRGGGG
jgi:GDP-4-dehydro-6-deoxy-D-mannose reductase